MLGPQCSELAVHLHRIEARELSRTAMFGSSRQRSVRFGDDVLGLGEALLLALRRLHVRRDGQDQLTAMVLEFLDGHPLRDRQHRPGMANPLIEDSLLVGNDERTEFHRSDGQRQRHTKS